MFGAAAEEISHCGGDEDKVTDAEARLGKDKHNIDDETTGRAADGFAEISERSDAVEAGEGLEFPAGVDEEHHTEEGEGGYEEECEEAQEPSSLLEGVRKSEHAGADDGDEDICKGFWLRRQCSRPQKRSVFRRRQRMGG